MSFRGTILALDPATVTGICVGVAGERPQLYSQNFRRDPSDEPEKIFERATFWLADYLKNKPIDLVALEAPFPSQNFAVSMITLGLFGIFTGIAGCKGIPIMRAQISSWRKFFLSAGRMPGAKAKREAMRVCAALGWEPDGHDSAEAAGIWAWTCSQVVPDLAPRTMPLFLPRAKQDASHALK